MIANLLSVLVVIPFLGLIGCLLMSKKWERAIFVTAMAALFAEIGVLSTLLYVWFSQGAAPVEASLGTLYAGQHYTLSATLYFDKLSAVFMSTTVVMTTLIFIFSKYYMHREPGFKRFYDTVLLFFIGLTFIILAGNFEVLFFGWELIGITSVLLIAFYRDRYLPARNALKVFATYRIADTFLLMAILFAHHTFDKNIHFSAFPSIVANHGDSLVVLGLLFFAAALIKSAQFPFSYWLPRAMEGPTTSSAIFYGALSVHMGLFLLLRTYPLWEGSDYLRSIIAVSGLATAVVASSIARVQSSAKTQIAYASIAQIGIMFIELAAGLHWLVLIHFVSNACLRTYQLLISPSVVSYLVHDQFFNFKTPVHKIKGTFVGKIRATVFVLGIKEWGMNAAVSRYLWMPLKYIGRTVAFLDRPFSQIIAMLVFAIVGLCMATFAVSESAAVTVSVASIVVGIAFYIRAYTMKGDARAAWNLIMLGHLFGALFLAVASEGSVTYLITYSAGIVAAYIAGHACLKYLKLQGEKIGLQQHRGAVYRYVRLSYVFLIVCLLFMTFPMSPSFLAQDILLSLVQEHHGQLVLLFCITYPLAGVSILRLYTKVFFGPHIASSHEKAFKSS